MVLMVVQEHTDSICWFLHAQRSCFPSHAPKRMLSSSLHSDSSGGSFSQPSTSAGAQPQLELKSRDNPWASPALDESCNACSGLGLVQHSGDFSSVFSERVGLAERTTLCFKVTWSFPRANSCRKTFFKKTKGQFSLPCNFKQTGENNERMHIF